MKNEDVLSSLNIDSDKTLKIKITLSRAMNMYYAACFTRRVIYMAMSLDFTHSNALKNIYLLEISTYIYKEYEMLIHVL